MCTAQSSLRTRLIHNASKLPRMEEGSLVSFEPNFLKKLVKCVILNQFLKEDNKIYAPHRTQISSTHHNRILDARQSCLPDLSLRV